MSGTKRIPLARVSAGPPLTSRALELFRAVKEAEQARAHRVGCTVNTFSGYCNADCPACSSWSTAVMALHHELALRPWHIHCLPFNPYPPGSAAAALWEPDPEEQARYDQLDAALAALEPEQEAPVG